LNHDAVEGTNPNGNPKESRERVEPWIEDRVEPINLVPPPPTDSERRLQQMVLDLGIKYDALSRTMDQK
jgi:alkanesulfonate monooxygenase SsuD/methylene tetrahydromethanopterin reductase-like flavin-dependent oxidoreductase (luciferase family)